MIYPACPGSRTDGKSVDELIKKDEKSPVRYGVVEKERGPLPALSTRKVTELLKLESGLKETTP